MRNRRRERVNRLIKTIPKGEKKERGRERIECLIE
jgi:hypothetical protein